MTLTGIVTLASLDDLEVQADVAEAQFHKVQASGRRRRSSSTRSPTSAFAGRCREVRQMVDRSKASVTVKVKFTDPPADVLPDMAAKVSFLTKALDRRGAQGGAQADRAGRRGGRARRAQGGVHHRRGACARDAGDGQGRLRRRHALELTDGPITGTRVIRRPGDKIRDGVSVKEKKK